MCLSVYLRCVCWLSIAIFTHVHIFFCLFSSVPLVWNWELFRLNHAIEHWISIRFKASELCMNDVEKQSNTAFLLLNIAFNWIRSWKLELISSFNSFEYGSISIDKFWFLIGPEIMERKLISITTQEKSTKDIEGTNRSNIIKSHSG